MVEKVAERYVLSITDKESFVDEEMEESESVEDDRCTNNLCRKKLKLECAFK
jgi:hypothetical protein